MRLRVRDGSTFTLPKKAKRAVRQGDLFRAYRDRDELVLRPVRTVAKHGSIAARFEEMRAGWDVLRGRFTDFEPPTTLAGRRTRGSVAETLAEAAIERSGGDPAAAVEELREAQRMIGDD